jgi:phosphatidylglycerophosphatase GEP4
MPLNLPALRRVLSSLNMNPNPLLPHAFINQLFEFPDQPKTINGKTVAFEDLLSGSSNALWVEEYPRPPRIKALILDKDNTITLPNSLITPPAITQKLEELKKRYSLLIVSNTAGAGRDKTSERLARETEEQFGIPVLRQKPGQLKPLCGEDALQWLKDRNLVEHAGQICVVGDRIATDVLMGNLMGSWTCWVQQGVLRDNGEPSNWVS